MKKRIISLLTSLLMVFSLAMVMPSTSVSATQSKTSNFNTSYSLTGNAASDMVAIAKAQIGRTQSQFGYTEAWCADFVSDCAKLAGQSDAIPANGSCYSLMSAVTEAGGYDVEKSQAKAGDLVFFSSSSYPNGGAHVELVYDYSNGILKSIGGNCYINDAWRVYDRSNGSSSSVSYYCVIRPNYNNTPPILPGTITNLGDSFTATIKNVGSGKYVTNISGDAKLYESANDKVAAQRWNFTRNSDNSYSISSNISGQVLDVYAADDKDTANVYLYDNVGGTNQKWFIYKISDGNYYFRPAHSTSRVLDIKDGSSSNESNIQIYTYNGSNAQLFEITKCDPVVNIGDDFSALIINADAQSKPWKPIMQNDNGNVILGSESTTNYDATLWHFIRNSSDGTYQIYSFKNGKVLDVCDFKDEDGNNIQCCDLNSSTAQRWYIIRRSDGIFRLKAQCTSRVLDIKDGSTESGANVQIYSSNDTTAQCFRIYQLDSDRDKINYTISADKNSVAAGTKVDVIVGGTIPYVYNYKFYVTDPSGVETEIDNKCNPVYSFTGTSMGKYTIYAIIKNPLYESIKSDAQKKAITINVTCAHKTTKAAANTATCTASGNIEYWYCSNCKKYFSDVDCTKEITLENTVVEAMGHKYTTKVIAPTCTEQGYTLHTCSVCGESYKDTYTNAKGHSFGSWTTITEATCTADGEQQRKCSVCDSVEKQVIKATGHEYGDWTTTKTATCTTDGVQTRKCSVCGDTETKTIAKTGHEYTTKVVAPTCTEQGYTLHTCSVCGDSYKDNYTDNLNQPDPNTPQIVVDTKTASAGTTVTVNVSIKNNPGIVALKVKIGYDENIFSLDKAELKDYDSAFFGPVTSNPVIIGWGDSINGNNTTDGILAQLTFTVKDDAKIGEYPITISFEEDEIYNSDWENVAFEPIDGVIKVEAQTPGDVNDDGKVNMRDYSILQRYLSGWDVTINKAAADVNGDGKINMRDYSLLQRYLSGWDVELG